MKVRGKIERPRSRTLLAMSRIVEDCTKDVHSRSVFSAQWSIKSRDGASHDNRVTRSQ